MGLYSEFMSSKDILTLKFQGHTVAQLKRSCRKNHERQIIRRTESWLIYEKD